MSKQKTLADKGIPTEENRNVEDAQVKAYKEGRPIPNNPDAVVNKEVRKDEQQYPDRNIKNPADGTIPVHEKNDIEGVIQEKRGPNAPITEKLPNEQDLAEGKITPAAVNKPEEPEQRDVRAGNDKRKRYHGGVTQEDIDSGKVSLAGVREMDDGQQIPDEDQDMYDAATVARNQTAFGRLNHAEVVGAFKTLKDNGYTLSKAR